MKSYLDLSKKILSRGEYEWNERTKTGTLALFGEKSEYNLKNGFPLTTTKKVAWRLPVEEMMYFMRGDSNLGILLDKNINIWNGNGFDFYLRRNNLEKEFPKHSPEWRNKFNDYIYRVKNCTNFRKNEGTLGRIYGVQERNWKGPNGETIDQLKNFIKKLKHDSSSRSNIVSHFNPAEMNKMSLGPCHLLYQSRVIEDDNRLDLLMYQRSADNLLGVPFNATQYGFLMEMLAKETGLKAGKFTHMFGNIHYYIGTNPRSEFLRNKNNLEKFQNMFNSINENKDYFKLKDWYLAHSLKELSGTEGTDQIPFALIQMARTPMDAPTLEFKIDNFKFWDAIKMNAKDLIDIKNYNPEPNLIYEFNGKRIKPLMAS